MKPSNAAIHNATTLAELPSGGRAVVGSVGGDQELKRRLSALGLVRGTKIAVDHAAPLGDPRVYSVLGYQLTLRNEVARLITLQGEG